MSIRDGVSSRQSDLIQIAAVSGNGTIDGESIDTQDFDEVAFYAAATAWVDGAHALNIQESDDDITFTDVAAAQIIGTEPVLGAATAEGAVMDKVGTFGTERFLRAQIVSTGVTTGADIIVTTNMFSRSRALA